MSDAFFDQPILNSPYECPQRHWELNAEGQPTHRIIESRRTAEFITPIPQPQKRKGKSPDRQQRLHLDEGHGLSTEDQEYDPNPIINEIRGHVARWRASTNPSDWRVRPETARLLQHWRHHEFTSFRPFFCQIEAVETVIWLTEVAPHSKAGKRILQRLADANLDANPEILRLAIKAATGAGKTTIMAMLIAWQTVNAVRRGNSQLFTRGFLIVTPGLTIKDRLRILQPNDLNNYYSSRELVPADMLDDIQRAKIVITNYHAFKRRERLEVSKGGRQLLQGRRGEPIATLESEGQMLQRVMPELMGMKRILAINDEGHPCNRSSLPRRSRFVQTFQTAASTPGRGVAMAKNSGKPTRRLRVRATSDGTAGTITVGGDAEPTTTSEQEREQREIELPSWTAAEFGYDGSHWLWIINSANTGATLHLSGWPNEPRVWDAFTGKAIDVETGSPPKSVSRCFAKASGCYRHGTDRRPESVLPAWQASYWLV